MLDILQSYVIKGVIILVIIQAMLMLQQTLYERSQKAQREQEMFQMSAVLSSDMRRIGGDTTLSRPYFLIADTSTLRFMIGDSVNFNKSYQIDYNLVNVGSTSVLQRLVTPPGGTVLPIGRNLTRFQCTFYDSAGNTLTPTPLSSSNRLLIKSIFILARMQTTTTSQDTVWSIWSSRIYPQNLVWN
jgi:hypothetical protein